MSKFLITSFAIDKLYSRGSEIWTNLVGKKLLNKETNKKIITSIVQLSRKLVKEKLVW